MCGELERADVLDLGSSRETRIVRRAGERREVQTSRGLEADRLRWCAEFPLQNTYTRDATEGRERKTELDEEGQRGERSTNAKVLKPVGGLVMSLRYSKPGTGRANRYRPTLLL